MQEQVYGVPLSRTVERGRVNNARNMEMGTSEQISLRARQLMVLYTSASLLQAGLETLKARLWICATFKRQSVVLWPSYQAKHDVIGTWHSGPGIQPYT